MTDAIEGARSAQGTLHLSRFVEPIYFITQPIGWRPNKGDKEGLPSVLAPAGFVTDLASIPTPFFSLLRPDGAYAYAAIVHDYLYWTQQHEREIADRIFKKAMQDFGVKNKTIAVIYNAVRVGGESAWNSNAELKRQGERRILKVFPTDPVTRWADYKKNASVFE